MRNLHLMILFEGQNGFRKCRSTIDHLSTLTSIVDTRRKRKINILFIYRFKESMIV